MASREYKEKQAKIATSIAELIKSLTEFREGDENFRVIQRFALTHINAGQYLDANSHEVKRRLEGVCEKLQIANYAGYAKTFRDICDRFTNHPVCMAHTERDIQWSVMQFLLEVARNPVSGLKERLQDPGDPGFAEFCVEDIPSPSKTDDVKDKNPSEFDYYDDESELSDWTDSELESDAEEGAKALDTAAMKSPTKPALPPKPVTIVSKLEPPKRSLNYKKFDENLVGPWLRDNLQTNWWKEGDVTCTVASKHQAANFCEYWNQLLPRASYNYIKLEQISTVSEYCLVREICWMFICPTTTKFFRLDGDRIRLQPNISIPSVTLKGLRSFLKEFVEKMTIMRQLRQFCHKVQNQSPPRTVEAYTAELTQCLDIVTRVVIDKERSVMSQFPGSVETLIELHRTLVPHFRFLEHLWYIHRSSILDWHKYSNEVVSAHLLASLAVRIIKARNNEIAALACTLYIRSLKPYIEIIDIWWTEGRFEDWQHEFIVAPTRYPELNTRAYSPKFCHVEENRHPTVTAGKLKLIEKDNVIRILLQHSITAGDTLNILAQLDRMNDLKRVTKKADCSLYDTFVRTVLAKFEKFRTSPVTPVTPPSTSTLDPMKASQISMMTESMMSVDEAKDLSAKITEFKEEIQEIGSDLLLLALEGSLSITEKEIEIREQPQLYEKLKSLSSLVVPFQVTLMRTLEEILASKLRIAQEWVLKIYREEFHLALHLQNLRKVYFLQATVAMQSFFIPLFQEIEAGKSWSNPYMLTLQLSHAMSPILADSTNLFNVDLGPEFRCATTDVLQAVDEVSISYTISDNLKNIVKSFDIDLYNRILRFFLKVKWAVWTVEHLKFPPIFKNRRPYAKLTRLDIHMRRLMIIRTWINFYISCIHSHMIHQIVINLDDQLDRFIGRAKSLSRIIVAHQTFISLAYDNCFLTDTYIKIRENLMQFLKLVSVFRDEWNSLERVMDLDRTEEVNDLIENANIAVIEKAYTDLHNNLVKQLEVEVYKRGKRHLGELLAAFSSSMPV